MSTRPLIVKIIRVEEGTDVTLPEEHLMFSDWFDSFNSPGTWVYTEDKGNRGPWGLIHDGHSTILLYDSNKPDLPWVPLSEGGAYIIEAEVEGEGGVIFQPTTEIPVDLYFEKKRIDLVVRFNAESAKAMHMTLKQYKPSEFIPELIARIRDILFKVLFSGSEEIPEFKEGEKLEIPESSFPAMMKFGVLGLVYEEATIRSVTEGTPPPELEEELEVRHIVVEEEKVWEKLADELSDIDDIEDVEEIEEETVVPPLPSLKKPRPQETMNPSIPSPKAKAQPPTPKAPPAPQQVVPPAPAPQPAVPPSPEASRARTREKSGIEPPKKKRKKKRATPPLPVSKPVMASEVTVLPETEVRRAEREEEELVTGGMRESTDSPLVMKSLKTSWYDRMVLAKTYPVDVTIHSQKQVAKASKTSLISGERQTDKVQEVEIKQDTMLEVRPEFPGCIVTPQVRYVEPDVQKATMRFFVTPLSKGSMDCKIVLLQDRKVVAEVDLPTKVIDHRLSRLITLTGAAISGVPAAAGYAAGVTLSELLAPRFLPLYGVSAIMGVFGGIYYLMRRAGRRKDQSNPISF